MKTEKEIEIKLKILNKSDLSPESYDDFVGKLQKTMGGKNNKHGVSVFSEPAKILETSYYDTKTMDLRKSKIAYRVRVDEGTKVATIKTDIPQVENSSGILAQRLEQTATIPENTNPDNFIEIFKETIALDVLKPVIGRKSLELLFTTKFDRKSYLIEQKDKYKILLCIDSGEIICEGNTKDIYEIELELLDGEMDDIFNVAYIISNLIPVNAEIASKYARGLVLSGKVSPKEINQLKPVKKYKIPERTLPFEKSIKMAVSYILNNLIYYKFAAENHQSDYEAVHAFRVLLRHLISITGLAKPIMNDKYFKEMRKLMKISLKKSAKTRETDIFLRSWKEFSDTLDETFENEKNIANKISAILVAYRHFERAGFQVALNDGNFTSLRLLVEKWLYENKNSVKNISFDENGVVDESTKTGESDIQPNDILSEFINQKDSLISELSSDVKSLKAKKLHKIRLAVKEKRYILKYFNVGLSENELAAETDNLKAIQDTLGELNDAIFNLDYAEKILPDCNLTEKYRKWLKENQLSLCKSFGTDIESIYGE